MSQPLTEDQLRQAMETCASEPAHIPGSIQPMGFLLACDFDEGIIHQVSENCEALFGKPLDQVLGQTVRDLMGSAVWHNLNNLRATETFATARQFAGAWHHDETEYAVHVSKGGERYVVEIEEAELSSGTPADIAQQQVFLVSQIERCTDLKQLFELTVKLLRHASGFDRVMVISFDADWNGEVVAEARSRLTEPLLGLRFPHHDIPAQARELMRHTPMRIISDVHQTPVGLVGLGSSEPPLDMTYALCRGVSAVHMQYLHNMGLGATMSMTAMLGDELWGYVSFHSQKPRILPPETRRLLLSFMPVFRLKLGLILQETALKLSRQIDQLQTDVQAELEKGSELEEMMRMVGPSIISILDAKGVVVTNGSDYYSHGDVPRTAVIATLTKKAAEQPGKLLIVDNLKELFPELVPHLYSFAGVLVTTYEETRSLLVFRNELTHDVSWAGNPEKTIEAVEDDIRIKPRTSFQKYLQHVSGKSKAWSRDDVHRMRQLWPLLSAAERRAFLATLNRQQNLMINELNHRVRNILALVKSVSTQARRSGSSLESYSNALEARIHALAAAHDIGAGAAKAAVSVFEILELEAEPYVEGDKSRVKITGQDASIRAEAAPIFALVIHELMTNAVKYGALSVPGGSLFIEVSGLDDGFQLNWYERNGPTIKEPAAKGFGTTLITQAVPYEMGGTAEQTFAPTGVEVILTVPGSVLGEPIAPTARTATTGSSAQKESIQALRNGLLMLVEDNFMIAEGMRENLEDAGFANVEMLPGVSASLDFLDETTPNLAILDVNLGQGETSERIASELLLRKVPFIFVTGYGEQNTFPPHLNAMPTLTKPVTMPDLIAAIDKLIV